MIKKKVIPHGVLLMAAMVLVACGGGGGGNGATGGTPLGPAPLSTPDDGVKTIALLAATTSDLGVGDSPLTAKSSQTPGEKSLFVASATAIKEWSLRRSTTSKSTESYGTRAKAEITEDCDTGRTVYYDPVSRTIPSPVFPQDNILRVVPGEDFDCVYFVNDTGSIRDEYDGSFEDGCSIDEFSTCDGEMFYFKQGTPANRYRLAFIDESTGVESSAVSILFAEVHVYFPEQDTLAAVKLDLDLTLRDGGEAFRGNFQLGGSDFFVVKDAPGMTVMTTTLELDGDVGFSSPDAPATCTVGKVNFDTTEPLVLSTDPDSFSESITDGVLKISSGGNIATLTFNADKSVTVQINDGASKTYTEAEFNALVADSSCV
ncbi:MAG: hypothetical protein ACLGHI_07350 [Gammaproteobacteria bacterium]